MESVQGWPSDLKGGFKMKQLSELRNFIVEREEKIQKGFNWLLIAGNLLLLIVKFAML
jgi:hypothetical protein